MNLDNYAKEIQNFIKESYERKTFRSLVLDNKGNRKVALSYYYACLQYAREYDDLYVQGVMYFNIAYLFTCMKRYKDAREHYYGAIGCFEKMEETKHQKENLVQCMVFCGLCYLFSEEMEEALELLERIREIRKNAQEGTYPEICMMVFEAGCANARGDRVLAGRTADRIEAAAFLDENLEEVQESLALITDLLVKTGNSDRIAGLIELLDEKNLENNTSVFLDLYPMKSQYLLEQNRIAEYIAYTRQYFALYEKQQQDGREVTARIIELQDKLWHQEQERRDIQAYNRNLEFLALYDSLTGLANRSHLNEYLSQKFEKALENQTLFGVELMDIDCFKEYNDTYGHLAGDKCIEAVANVLRGVGNDNMFCARYGGDEFMMIYTDMTAKEIRKVAETIQTEVRALKIEHNASEAAKIVTVSQGIFVKIPSEENREWDFNSMADIILYEAKKEGRNRFRIATDFLE
uniref:GGDEF domain-containing protein n=1 Tax=Acetatifactor sp. TaxID=1872090 RepID=UPI00405643DF